MPLKVTLLLQGVTGSGAGGAAQGTHLGGWSESIYYGPDDIVALRARLFTAGVWGPGLCPARAALLPPSARIVGQRIATVFPRLGRSQTTAQQFPGSSGALTDVPQMSLMFTVPALVAVNTRRSTIRCIPDSFVSRGEFLPDAAFGTSLLAYFNQLSAFYFPGQDQTQPFFAIDTIGASGIVQFLAIPPFVVGDILEGRATKDPLGNFFSWRHRVRTLGPGVGQVTLDEWPNGLCVGGEARKVQTFLYQIDGSRAGGIRAVVRKIGRPFEQYRGRRGKVRTR